VAARRANTYLPGGEGLTGPHWRTLVAGGKMVGGVWNPRGARTPAYKWAAMCRAVGVLAKTVETIGRGDIAREIQKLDEQLPPDVRTPTVLTEDQLYHHLLQLRDIHGHKLFTRAVRRVHGTLDYLYTRSLP
jgi:hypothetical protein